MLFRLFTVLALLALAVSTWQLTSPAHRLTETPAAGKAVLPGYYLKNAVLTDYDAAGSPVVRIVAERIDQIDHTPEVQLAHVRVDYAGPGAQNWALFGDVGRVEKGGMLLDVSGNVRLQGESAGGTPAAVVHTDDLSYDIEAAVASTKSDVRIDFGVQSLTAHGLIANLKERTMRLESKVNGRYQP